MKNIIIIHGPTGSGKTQLSYDISHYLKKNNLDNNNLYNLIKNIYKTANITHESYGLSIPLGSSGSIINMDSKQIYYHLKELTASPSHEEQSQYFHYLFNYENPQENLNVNDWFFSVMDFIDNTSFDHYILVGGSSFYLKYLVTHDVYYNNYNFDDLIDIYFKYFPWDFNVKVFKTHRYEPHINDDFRKYNFIKFYFMIKYGSHLLDHNKNVALGVIYKKNLYDYYWITLNPSVKILENNIKNRAEKLPIDLLRQEAQWIHNHYHVHKNFQTIIGYNQLINKWQYERFLIDTVKYGKTQKKWINYFLKNKFFNYNYFYCQMDI